MKGDRNVAVGKYLELKPSPRRSIKNGSSDDEKITNETLNKGGELNEITKMQTRQGSKRTEINPDTNDVPDSGAKRPTRFSPECANIESGIQELIVKTTNTPDVQHGKFVPESRELIETESTDESVTNTLTLITNNPEGSGDRVSHQLVAQESKSFENSTSNVELYQNKNVIRLSGIHEDETDYLSHKTIIAPSKKPSQSPTKKQNKYKPDVGSSDEETLPKKPSESKNHEQTNTSHYIYNIIIEYWYILAILVGFVSLVVALITFGVIPLNNANLPFQELKEFNLVNRIKEVERLHPVMDVEFWQRLQVGLEIVKNFSRPSIFMLAHHNNEILALDLVKKIGEVAAIYLKNGEEKARPMILLNADLHLKDHGELIRVYEEKFKENHVMIVNGIEKVSGLIAQGFRYFCDEYSPMVDESAVFFTINLKGCPTFVEESIFKEANTSDTTRLIEDCLKSSWESELNINVIQPVLVRIIGTVIKITP